MDRMEGTPSEMVLAPPTPVLEGVVQGVYEEPKQIQGIDSNDQQLRQLQCAVCARVKESPQLLACLHSVCRGCLPPLIKSTQPTFACPTCALRTNTSLVVPTATPDFFVARQAQVHVLTKQKHICDSPSHEKAEEASALRGVRLPLLRGVHGGTPEERQVCESHAHTTGQTRPGHAHERPRGVHCVPRAPG